MANVLDRDSFSVLATEGLGRIAAATAHSMAYFRGALFLGTSCGNVSGADDAPRIYRYTPGTNEWETVYESPTVATSPRAIAPDRQVLKHFTGDAEGFPRRRTDGGQVPRDTGYRSMCVFQGRSDPEPALYVSTMSRSGGLLLRSLDGRDFEPVGEPGFGDDRIYSFRGLVGLGDRLFTAPAGTITDEYLDRNLAPEADVYVSTDPLNGRWELASDAGFGDPSNLAVYSLGSAHGRIYAGTANPERGFQVWQTDAIGSPPFRWTPVVVDGAGAFNHNLAVSAMVEFNGALYVGSGITGFGYDKVHDIGPASAELIRIHPDGSWDLIAGRMRFTPDGLKVPLSLLGPGLGDFYNSVVWALAVHDNAIYLGTHQWEAFQCLQTDDAPIVGGYQLWSSADGENWQPVIEDGRGNPADLGVRTLASTPHGLFVGTHNHSRLLKLMARRRRADVDFKPGFEVLLGH